MVADVLPALDEPSRRFAETLFARFPEWRAGASADDSGSLLVNLPSPADAERVLTLWMEQRDDPSFSFAGWHTHASVG